MNITDLTKPMPDEKSRAYRVPVEAEWFTERDCVVVQPGESFKRVMEGLTEVAEGLEP